MKKLYSKRYYYINNVVFIIKYKYKFRQGINNLFAVFLQIFKLILLLFPISYICTISYDSGSRCIFAFKTSKQQIFKPQGLFILSNRSKAHFEHLFGT